MVYNQEYHIISDDNYHWERYWKKALVVPLKLEFFFGQTCFLLVQCMSMVFAEMASYTNQQVKI